MKKTLALLGLALLAGAAALPAMANPITVTTAGTYFGQDVGSIDTLKSFGQVNSGDANETAYANSITGNSYTSLDKFCDGNSVCMGMLLTTSEAGVYAIHLATAPEFFMIKTGNGTSLSLSSGPYACTKFCDHFLFQNLSDASFVVFSMADMGFGASDTGKISHVDSFGGTTTNVPEPAALGMFGVGIGLLGLFLGLRRRAC